MRSQLVPLLVLAALCAAAQASWLPQSLDALPAQLQWSRLHGQARAYVQTLQQQAHQVRKELLRSVTDLSDAAEQAVVAAEEGVSGFTRSPAANCQELECPPFRLVHEESDFEIRRYRNSTWVATEPLQDISFNKATYTGFHSLFEYIEGENKESQKVPMTAPVVTAIVPSAGPFCSSAFVVLLYLPAKFASEPPTPKSSLKPKVGVAASGTKCVAVRKFGGFASDLNIAQQASALAESLKGTAWEKITESDPKSRTAYAIAQYNSPFELTKRVNEVWVGFEGGDDCKLGKKDDEEDVDVDEDVVARK